ncbi:hypothetical protein [Streptomyces longwoodensis]|uniref:hypothetical protein n=1 Tax=Streptomyces longwoodensis TaxID=68231 RepID=UPI0033F8EAF5
MDLLPAQHGGDRISAPAPAASDWDRWRKAIAVLRQADEWGSSDASGAPRIWAEVDREETV